MKYRLDRTWLESDTIEVEAHSLENAIAKAYDAPLTFGEYVDCSMIVYTDNYEEELENDSPNP